MVDIRVGGGRRPSRNRGRGAALAHTPPRGPFHSERGEADETEKKKGYVRDPSCCSALRVREQRTSSRARHAPFWRLASRWCRRRCCSRGCCTWRNRKRCAAPSDAGWRCVLCATGATTQRAHGHSVARPPHQGDKTTPRSSSAGPRWEHGKGAHGTQQAKHATCVRGGGRPRRERTDQLRA